MVVALRRILRLNLVLNLDYREKEGASLEVFFIHEIKTVFPC